MTGCTVMQLDPQKAKEKDRPGREDLARRLKEYYRTLSGTLPQKLREFLERLFGNKQ